MIKIKRLAAVFIAMSLTGCASTEAKKRAAEPCTTTPQLMTTDAAGKPLQGIAYCFAANGDMHYRAVPLPPPAPPAPAAVPDPLDALTKPASKPKAKKAARKPEPKKLLTRGHWLPPEQYTAERLKQRAGIERAELAAREAVKP